MTMKTSNRDGEKKRLSSEEVISVLDQLRGLRVLVIGDTIIDMYSFVTPKGRAVKDPILSVEYVYHETYAGGILAIANHISDFVGNVHVVTLIGDRKTRADFIRESLKKNTTLKTFVKENSPTILKKRYIDALRNNKLFKVEHMDDRPISDALSQDILAYLDQEIPKYDLCVVGDFGHGFINNQIRRKLREKAKFLAVNAQSNSSNMGFNYITQYDKPDFLSADEKEIRLPLGRRFEDLDDVLSEAHDRFGLGAFLVTRGKHGSVFVRNGVLYKSPSLTTTVKDTVGAGDALFAITSLFVYTGVEDATIPFLANCVGGIAVNIIGNRESVTRQSLLDFVRDVEHNLQRV